MPSIQVTKAEYADLVARGILKPQPKGGGKRKGPEFVAPAVAGRGGVLTATLPVRTASEANCRAWRVKSNRTKDARQVVSRGLGPHLRLLAPLAEHYHAGGTLRVTLTRLGGPKLDQMANLGPSLKATEDALCLLLGADDGDPRWRCEAGQHPGGPVGVRIEVEALPRGAGGGAIAASPFDTRPERRTKSQVAELRTKYAASGGCCERFADNKGCDCLERAGG